MLVWAVFILVLEAVCGEETRFICRLCGKDVSSLRYWMEMDCPDSVGRFRDETIPEKYGITYDSIPMSVRRIGFLECRMERAEISTT